MIRLQKKIFAGLTVLQYFSTRNWKFSNNKLLALWDKLSPTDQKLFCTFREGQVDEEKYIKDIVLGIRQYCMKEDLSTLPKARRHQKVMYVVHITVVYLFYFGIFYFVYNKCEIVNFLVNYVIQKIQSLFLA